MIRNPVLQSVLAAVAFALAIHCSNSDSNRSTKDQLGSTKKTGLVATEATASEVVPFSVSGTDSAQQNTLNTEIQVTAGQTVVLGTCGLSGASFEGDTYLRLFDDRGAQVAENDDACGGLGSLISYLPQQSGVLTLRVGCFAGDTCRGNVGIAKDEDDDPPVQDSLEFSVGNTSNAQRNTQNVEFTLQAGETLVVGTCGLEGANFNGDTFLRLFEGASNEVAQSDDACDGLGSQIEFTASQSGTFQARIGCYEDMSCQGRLAWSIDATGVPGQENAIEFSVSNTNNAQRNTEKVEVSLQAGDVLVAATCGLPDASFNGDTVIRVLDDSGREVGSNDDACGGLGSSVEVEAERSGTFEINVGCFESESCSGRLVFTINGDDDDDDDDDDDRTVFQRTYCPESVSDELRPDEIAFEKIIEIEPLTPGFAILEGPLWVDGELWLSHIGYRIDENAAPADIVVLREGQLSVLLPRYDLNGLTFDPDGNVVAARQKDGTITRVLDDEILASQFDSRRFNSPNDLVFSSIRGNIYFTDPDWQSPEVPPQSAERAYHVSPSGGVTAFGSVIEKPNGIMLSFDEETLYVGGVNGLYAFGIRSDGTVIDQPERIQADVLTGGVDGMSKDCAGNLWVTTNLPNNTTGEEEGQVVILEPGTHRVLGSYFVPSVTNVAFGGPDGRTIFATTLGERPQVWSARTSIPGFPF